MDKILRNKLRHRHTRTGTSKKSRSAGIWTALIMALVIFTSASAVAKATPLKGSPNRTPASAGMYAASDPFNMDISVTGITAEKHITCYPNPAISYINFKFDKSVPKDGRLFVFSFTGRKMEELAITEPLLKISLENYYRGLYVYQLRSAGGAILESGKFQVKN